ncbi:MAG: acyl-CoA dehydrogenase family protein [Gemmatimonadota bacterium]
MVSFALSDTIQAVRELMHKFAENEIRPVAPEHDEEESFPWKVLEKAREIGILLDYARPAEESENDRAENPMAAERNLLSAVAAEELGWGCAGITIAIQGTAFAAAPVQMMGSPEQRAVFGECLEGRDEEGHLKVASLALTEPDAGSDLSRVATTAVKDGDHYVLGGRKQFATNGSIASVYVVWASIDPSAGRAGLRAFVVPRGTPGLIPGKKERKLGIRASDTAGLSLEDCRVPAAQMLEPRRSGRGGAKGVLDATRPMVGALSLGVARAALEVATQHARERVQFGEPIAKKQGVAFQLADMAMEIEAARGLVWKAVWMADHGISNAAIAAMSKAKAAAVAMDTTTKAIQILGGYGFCRDYPVEKWFRDAKIMDIFEGTGQIQRTIIAQDLTGLDCK